MIVTPTIEPKHAALNIIKFHVRPLDLLAAQQTGHPVHYAFLSHAWAMASDIDIGSEWYADIASSDTFAYVQMSGCDGLVICDFSLRF